MRYGRDVGEQLAQVGEIVDAHANVGAFRGCAMRHNAGLFRDTVDALVGHMDVHGVRRAFVCSFDSILGADADGNRKLAGVQEEVEGRLYGFATVDPCCDSACSDLEYAAKVLRLRGLKLHPSLQQFDPRDHRVRSVLDLAGELQLPVMLHCGWTCENSSPPVLARIAKEHGNATFIFAHMGGVNVHKTAELVRPLDNVFLETSVSRAVFDPVHVVCRSVGSGRLMYGSDFPCGSMFVELCRILDAGLSSEQLGDVLCNTARRVIGV